MTRLDADDAVLTEAGVECDGPRALLLEAREVPLGGVRGMSVHRSLPQRDLPLVGAWCFLDRFGPQVTRMRVEPHPHIGLQTVTWPFSGVIRHRDSIDSDVLLSRGALNLMTSGAGISHSEYSVGEEAVELDALQLWVALPEARRHGGPAFERHEHLPTLELAAPADPAATATVVLGELGGVASPATVHTPIVGAEIALAPGARIDLPLHSDWEYAIVGVEGVAGVAAAPDAGIDVDRHHLLYLGTGRDHVEIAAPEGALIFVLGGEPFEDEIVMWWNFVGRSHEEIADAREAWEAGSPRFGHVVDHGDERVPAPPLPGVRLTRRQRRV
jgi:redox-sensitive bicupin YhaK (pirin superfamily)